MASFAQGAIPLDPKHAVFIDWVESQGVKIYGVAPANIPGKGIGMVATKRLSGVRSSSQSVISNVKMIWAYSSHRTTLLSSIFRKRHLLRWTRKLLFLRIYRLDPVFKVLLRQL
jgi:hypothetical protein